MKKIKQERGITLIALVITIIVLLILAGVAISMLSGENGILTRAAEAKEDTEEAQKEEETNLASMELETYFIINNLKYKCAYGYITGFEYDKEQEHTVETVAEVEAKLPDGYKIVSKYEADEHGQNGKDIKFNNEEEKKNTYISTGMVIAKDGQEAARTVLFGDITGNGMIEAGDTTGINKLIEGMYDYEKYQLVASDINHDRRLDYNDVQLMSEYLIIMQEAYAYNTSELIIESSIQYQQNIIANELPEEFRDSYNIYYDEITKKFILKLNDSKEVTAVEILNKLGNEYDGSYIMVAREDGNKIIKYGDKSENVIGIIVKENDILYIETKSITIKCYITI